MSAEDAKDVWDKAIITNQTKVFGQTCEMNDKVFQLQSEQKQQGQFRETLEQIHICSSSIHQKEIKHLMVLFTTLEKPVIAKPELASEAGKAEE